ncbi:MAG: hypothetical protein WBW01_17065 [Terriglobales bacterium]
MKAHRGNVMQKMKADFLVDLVKIAAKLRVVRASTMSPPRPYSTTH